MRPASEIRQALFSAACDFSASGGASLADLAAKACVGREAARRCVDNMKRAGDLRIVGQRRVEYRNRPVAVYQAVEPDDKETIEQGWVDLNLCMADWVR